MRIVHDATLGADDHRQGQVGSESERGVLRRQVPQWLGLPEFRALVIGFEEAHIAHGGEGALYVRVRRRRGSGEIYAQNGRMIPTRGMSVRIQPNTIVFRSSAARPVRRLQPAAFSPRALPEQAHRPVRNPPLESVEHDRAT